MKIKSANDGVLTNFEVLDFLRSKGASDKVAATVAPSEYKVFEYLSKTPACTQTRESIHEFLEKAKTFDLAKAEILNIINTRLTLPVGVFAIVEKCDIRLGEIGAEGVVSIVEEVLPPPLEQEQGHEELDQGKGVAANDTSVENKDGDHGDCQEQ